MILSTLLERKLKQLVQGAEQAYHYPRPWRVGESARDAEGTRAALGEHTCTGRGNRVPSTCLPLEPGGQEGCWTQPWMLL